jgi:hypothetical protein
MNTIQSQWNDYRNKVIADDAGPNQITETEQAFYAGNLTMFHMMLGISIDNDISEPAKSALMDSLLDEGMAYMVSRLSVLTETKIVRLRNDHS